MNIEEIKENDFVLIFRNYGKDLEKKLVKKICKYSLEFDNGEIIYHHEFNSGKLNIIKYTDELWLSAQIAYRAKVVSYALNFNSKLRTNISKEIFYLLESLLDKKEFERTISIGYTLGSLEKENSYIHDFLINKNQKYEN